MQVRLNLYYFMMDFLTRADRLLDCTTQAQGWSQRTEGNIHKCSAFVYVESVKMVLLSSDNVSQSIAGMGVFCHLGMSCCSACEENRHWVTAECFYALHDGKHQRRTSLMALTFYTRDKSITTT